MEFLPQTLIFLDISNYKSVKPNNLSLKHLQVKKLVAKTIIPLKKKIGFKKTQKFICHKKNLAEQINYF